MTPPQPDDSTSPNGHTWLTNQAPPGAPSVKRVFLHIGYEKTGSSAIQAFCSRNRDWLRQQNIDYPMIGSLPQHASIHFDLASRNPKRVHSLAQRLRQLIDASPCENIVFSHESLHLHNPQILRSMLAGYDTRIIAYLRHPTQASISHFATMVRFGRLPIHNIHRALRQYAKTMLPIFDYYWTLKAYASAFGHENIITRHYNPATLVGNQTTTDFLHLFGLNDLRKSSWPNARANPSLDADQFAFVALLAQLQKDQPRKIILKTTRRICDKLIQETAPDADRPFDLLVPDRIKKKIDRYFEPNLPMLYQDFFESKELFEPITSNAQTEPRANTSISPGRALAFHTALCQANIIDPNILDQVLDQLQAAPHAPHTPHTPLDAIRT